MILGLSLKKHIEKCHPYINIDYFENIFYDVQPSYSKAFDEVFNKSNVLFFSSSYILPYSEYCRYCNFLFSILDAYATRMNFLNRDILKWYVSNKLNYTSIGLRLKPIEYHMLIGGFLQERIFSVWVLSNFKQSEIYYKDFTFMENHIL